MQKRLEELEHFNYNQQHATCIRSLGGMRAARGSTSWKRRQREEGECWVNLSLIKSILKIWTVPFPASKCTFKSHVQQQKLHERKRVASKVDRANSAFTIMKALRRKAEHSFEQFVKDRSIVKSANWDGWTSATVLHSNFPKVQTHIRIPRTNKKTGSIHRDRHCYTQNREQTQEGQRGDGESESQPWHLRWGGGEK